MKERCEACGLKFEREPGYWVGATIVNTTIIFATFLLIFVGGIALTWPDVPWIPLLIVLIAVNPVVPIVVYPLSKTLWAALEWGGIRSTLAKSPETISPQLYGRNSVSHSIRRIWAPLRPNRLPISP